MPMEILQMAKKPPPGYVPIVGTIVEDGKVILTQPLPKPKPQKPSKR